MEWASEKWKTEARVAQNVVLNAPTQMVRDKAVQDIAKLEEKNTVAHKTRYLFRSLIVILGAVKFIYGQFLVVMAWNMVLVPFLGLPVLPSIWHAILIRVAVVVVCKVTPTRLQLDQQEAGRHFENGHLWFDRYRREWEVVYFGLLFLGLVHLFFKFVTPLVLV